MISFCLLCCDGMTRVCSLLQYQGFHLQFTWKTLSLGKWRMSDMLKSSVYTPPSLPPQHMAFVCCPFQIMCLKTVCITSNFASLQEHRKNVHYLWGDPHSYEATKAVAKKAQKKNSEASVVFKPITSAIPMAGHMFQSCWSLRIFSGLSLQLL